MNEAETRAELVDPARKAAGWGGVRKPDSARVHHFRVFATRKHPRQAGLRGLVLPGIVPEHSRLLLTGPVDKNVK